MSPNDPLFLTEIHTWCPRCGTPHAAFAGELEEQPELDCRKCHYSFDVDTRDLELEIAARRVVAAAQRQLAPPFLRDAETRASQYAAYASRTQQSIHPAALCEVTDY